MSEEGHKIIPSLSNCWQNFYTWLCRNLLVFLSDGINVTLHNSLFRKPFWEFVIILYTEEVWVFSQRTVDFYGQCPLGQGFSTLIHYRVSDLVSEVGEAASPPPVCLSSWAIGADCYGQCFQTSLVFVKPLWGPQKEGAIKCSVILFMKTFVAKGCI